jgi:hypothetical protein
MPEEWSDGEKTHSHQHEQVRDGNPDREEWHEPGARGCEKATNASAILIAGENSQKINRSETNRKVV